ncbi:M20/M25/M40 family metallo-hydrolase [Candidatus Uabimicrobium amorphum]|uniref:Peptidase M1 n=1 Tax=Uabimicrobium amorphum TaxID=2596890 RepID=A0A5S9F0R2_UABAM|nr:M20/M25/M40 family metallo-hydrolase [Candidatus Uabimicrobium amorphum]BBM81847.1 peptidase M1 [Candidatus Uabimicrobium amorphum]
MSKRFIFVILILNILYALDINHHEIILKLDPKTNHLNVTDTMTYKNTGDRHIEFSLHGNLPIQVKSSDWKLEFIGKVSWDASGINAYYKKLDKLFPIHNYRLTPTKQLDSNKVTVVYGGKITLPPTTSREEYVRSFSETPGIVCKEGVYLTSTSLWYPQQQGKMVSFSLKAHLPKNWQLISQGKEKFADKDCVVWDCTSPMEEIYVVGGPLTKFERVYGKTKAMVYTHSYDEGLADKYLTATGQYLKMYNDLLGKYPYSKFALVENFWETGYGMPSFTLLGPRIIRFPFILRSSYPHEILHNWWGNGVFVDYKTGNWCEGLTAYLADHLLKEQEGKGVESRRSTLQRYRNFVRQDRDFPLAQFRSRHSPETEAVGYGKCLMLFHELRQKLGDKVFTLCLREFYKKFLFKKASFDDIEKTFSQVTKQDLKSFFVQRVQEKGAPDIGIKNVYVEQNKVHFSLEQLQKGIVYNLQIPIAVTYKDGSAELKKVQLNKQLQAFVFDLPKAATRIDIDPQFDLFRKVHRSEIPTSFGQLFGSTRTVLVSQSPSDYQAVLDKWGRGRLMYMVSDDDLSAIPKNSSVWFLGQNHKYAEKFRKIFTKTHGVTFGKDYIQVGNNKPVSLKDHMIVLCTQHPQNEELAIGWILGDKMEAIAAVARKLPHYGKYSYLAFSGAAANNVLKGQWSVLQSQMTYHLTTTNSAMGKLPPRQALCKLPVMLNDKGLRKHVSFLTSPQMKGRGLGTPELDKVGEYIANSMKSFGLRPGNGNSYYQSFTTQVKNPQRQVKIHNVMGMIPGTDPQLKNEPVILCAHYDHLGLGWPDVKKGNEGKIHFGADDNASGVAVMLEMAKLFVRKPGLRPLIFIAFSGEEAGRLGSKYYVSQLKSKPFTVINIDSVGRLDGRALLALGTGCTREWPFICFGCGAVTNVKITSVPESEDSSDHSSFVAKGIPAIQLFSGPHAEYHSPKDTMDRLDFPGMVNVMLVVQEMLNYVVNRKKPFTIFIKNAQNKTTKTNKNNKERRASLGSIPDFTYRGPGVRISGVVPGSAAAGAGMKKGDIVTKLGRIDINNLRGLSNALKEYKPGDKIQVVFQRDKKTFTETVTLKER